MIEGVEETLGYLSERHDLTLFTKGHPDEQLMKVDRSRLGRYFAHTAVVKEKDAAAYAQLVDGAGPGARSHMDDRQFAEVRHQSGARSRIERGAGAASAHLGAGASGPARIRQRNISEGGAIRGPAPAFLNQPGTPT